MHDEQLLIWDAVGEARGVSTALLAIYVLTACAAPVQPTPSGPHAADWDSLIGRALVAVSASTSDQTIALIPGELTLKFFRSQQAEFPDGIMASGGCNSFSWPGSFFQEGDPMPTIPVDANGRERNSTKLSLRRSRMNARHSPLAELVVLPSNPISMTLSPTTTGRNNKGPAHRGSDGKFYCYARGTVTNAFPREARVGPDVICSISDGGTVLETFNFSIGAFTVLANGWAGFNLVIWVAPGSPTHDVFTWHGDVRVTFTIATSEGFISGSAVWVAMARVDLALCFVGDFPDARRFAVQSIVDNEASAILESQNLYVGNTWTFLIPSSNPDHGRFRDIRMNDNKAQDCTAGAVEADELRGGWSSPNGDWLDVWFVDSLSGPACASSVLGFSPVPGPTDKDSTDSGFVVKVNGEVLDATNGRQRFGLTVAHELGHYLGLGHHPTDNTNFMWPFILVTNTNVEYAQFWDMADHGFVRDFTP